MKEKPEASATEATSTTQLSFTQPSVRTVKMNTINSNSIPTKHELCIYELLKAGTTGIHKIGKPQHSYGETCLPTTISELKLKRGLTIQREMRTHKHRAGGKTSFAWYWFPDRGAAERALILLNQMRGKRKAVPIDLIESEALLAHFPEQPQSVA